MTLDDSNNALNSVVFFSRFTVRSALCDLGFNEKENYVLTLVSDISRDVSSRCAKIVFGVCWRINRC